MDRIGQTLKNYRIDGHLSEGGMGTLFLGFDTKLRREVVLKSIRLGQQDPLAKMRFQREAYALSNLDHPNICRIYDYLEWDGEDYLVLEKIKGTTLDEVIAKGCDYRKKLQLAIQIAQALNVAHRSGFVHRDLKPSNVMVTPENTVKILDFGLAFRTHDTHMMSQSFDSGELDHLIGNLCGFSDGASLDNSEDQYTVQGSIVGTLDAMSPEQARGQRATIASDMYSLGLLLQRLFTEKPCYQESRSQVALLQQVASGTTIPAQVADKDLEGLIHHLKNMNPTERPTALETAEKLKAISRKPLRRLRLTLLAATLLIVLLGVTKYIIDLDRAHVHSELARMEAEEVTSFMLEVFKIPDPAQSLGDSISTRELLAISAERLETETDLKPSTKARLMYTIGEVYKNLGMFQQAEKIYQRALTIARRDKQANPTLVANCFQGLGSALNHLGHYTEAIHNFKQGLTLREKGQGENSLEVADSLSSIGDVYWQQSKFEKAESFYLRAFAIREQVLEPGHRDLATSLSQLGSIYRHRGDYPKAQNLFQKSLRILENRLGFNHPALVTPLVNLGIVLRCQGQKKEAGQVFQRALQIQEQIFGLNHANITLPLINLALIQWSLGDTSQAEKNALRALQIRTSLYGPDHLKTGYPHNILGHVRLKQGRLEEAETHLSKALSIWQTQMDPGTHLLAWPLSALACVRRDQGRFGEAETLFEKAIDIRKNTLTKDHPDLVHTQTEYAALLSLMAKQQTPAP